MKKYFLVAAISLLPHWVLAAQPDGTCPGRAVDNISDYNIPAGSFFNALRPGSGDSSGEPPSYEYRDAEGHHLFLPVNSVRLISCRIQKHKRSGFFDVGYSIVFTGKK